ncbi:MAG: HAD family phosphatase [Eubacterium sp.]|nr:HAD family phosphatase [Eubacterium sp.]
MIKAVIFDMDGVIIDSERDYQQIEIDMYKQLGISMTAQEAQESMGKVTLEWWREVIERFGLKASAEALAEAEDKAYLDYLFSDETQKTMCPGVDRLLQALKARGLKTAVASSSLMDGINRVMAIFNLDAYFDLKLSGQQVACGKPAPDIFLRAAELLGVLPEECLVIEDSFSGIKAAKAAGMGCVAYLSAPEGVVDYSAADYRVKNYDDFFEAVAILKG